MRVRDLNPAEHVGAIARVDNRIGRLSYGRVPNGAGAFAWYLIVPMTSGPFDESALSLQWATEDEIAIIAAVSAL